MIIITVAFSQTHTVLSSLIKVKADIALHGNLASELWDVTCHSGGVA